MRSHMRQLGYPGGAPLIVRTVMEECTQAQE